MTAEDLKWLESLNEKAANENHGRLTLDVFEEIISFFEATAALRQPFATIDSPPVLAFDEMQAAFDYTISEEGQKWASEVYPYWHDLRDNRLNQPLMPSLKFETGAETDDADAYVCFRRREVRQIRKTRGRDAQVVEKLKKLRRELEDARQLVHTINAREKLNLDKFEIDRKVFDQRQELKQVKIQHGIKGDKGDDDELLITPRPAARPTPQAELISGGAGNAQHRPSTLKLTASGRLELRNAPEQDLRQLADVREEADALVRQSVETKIQRHREWNRGFTDDTWKPICPPDWARATAGSAHLPVIAEVQLPTPPASVEGDAEDKMDVDPATAEPKDLPTPPSDGGLPKTMFRFQSPPAAAKKTLPTFRRRYGRLGRLRIDAVRPRRVLPAPVSGVVYDSDSDMDDASDSEAGDVAIVPVDYYSSWNLNYRASLMNTARKQDAAQQQQQQQQAASESARKSASAPAVSDAPVATGGAQ